MGQKLLLIYLIVIAKLENQRQFDEIYEYVNWFLTKNWSLSVNLFYTVKLKFYYW